jgi:hypothetical protein
MDDDVEAIRGRKHCFSVQAEKDISTLLLKLDVAQKSIDKQADLISEQDGKLDALESRLDSLTAVVRQVIECGPSVISDRCADTLENALVVENPQRIPVYDEMDAELQGKAEVLNRPSHVVESQKPEIAPCGMPYSSGPGRE